MWWKSTFKTEGNKSPLLRKQAVRQSAQVLIALVLLATSTSAQITVVYPKSGQTVGAVDSTFIFGHLPPIPDPESYALAINGHDIPVHKDGGFLAFLPIEPGEFVFHLKVTHPDQWRDLLTVMVPEPRASLGPDSVFIAGAYRPPGGDLDLISGDRLSVSFIGTPGCRAWFSVDGALDSVPMSESDPRTQPYWGEAVFGSGAVPDSLMIRGIYAGFVDIADSVRVDSARITYHLAPPSLKDVAVRLFGPDSEYGPRFDLMSYLRLARMDSTASRTSSYAVSLNSRAFPFTVRFTDSVQIIRHGPRKGYLSIFQPEGVEALAVGGEGDWYRLRLSQSQTGWVHRDATEPLAQGVLPPHSYLRSIRTYNHGDRVSVQFPLTGKHPFRVIEDDPRTIRIQLFGVTSDTDWIRYDFSDSLVELATWSQPEPGLYEFKLCLTRDLWGYDTYYRGTTLCLDLMRAPEKLWTIRGKRIVIDPGHSHDLGAVGPTGYTEAEANLGIALAVRRELAWRGAEVVMTRDDARDLPLYERPAIAKASEADLFVSIHNNALPDGVNPFANFGTSTYYYHAHSIELARCIHRELVKASGLPDRGLYHGNLAVNRPTQYPAVLLECAFMMIPEQEALLKTEKYCKKLAHAICDGIERFLEVCDHE